MRLFGKNRIGKPSHKGTAPRKRDGLTKAEKKLAVRIDAFKATMRMGSQYTYPRGVRLEGYRQPGSLQLS